MSKTANGGDIGTDDIKAQLAEVREDIRVLAGMLGEAATGRAEALKGEAAGRAGALKGEALARANALKDEAEAALDRASAAGERAWGEAEATIRANPLIAVGGAFAIGWLIGRAVRR